MNVDLKRFDEGFDSRNICEVARDDVSGSDLPGVAVRAAVRLHRDRRGAISMLFVLLSFVFFTAMAGVWNTGKAVAGRMHSQVVADTSAYAAAVWMSRGVNQITATNILIQRNVMGFAIAFDCMPLGIVWALLVIKNWVDAVNDALAIPFVGAAVAAALAAYIFAVEVPIMGIFFAGTAAEAAEGLTEFPERISELFEYQEALVDNIPKVIEDQRKKMEEYYGTKIRFTQPGESNGEVKMPVEKGQPQDYGPVFLLDLYRFLQKDHNIPEEYNFSVIAVGKGEDEWDKVYMFGFLLAAFGFHMPNFHKLTTHDVFEFPPDSLTDWEDFSVVSTAMAEKVSEDYRVAPGIFTWSFSPDDVMIAYAQAETYNAPSEILSEIPVVGAIADIYPFRVFTFLGFEWQPRLTKGNQVKTALENDNEMRNMWEKIDFNNAQFGNINAMVHH